MSANINNILIADDHFVVRQGMEIMLCDIFDEINLFHASTLAEVYQTLQKHVIHLIVLDANFPDGNTINEIKNITGKYPDVKILIYSALDEHLFGLKFYHSGVDGFLSKLAEEQEITKALENIKNHRTYFSPKLQQLISTQSNHISTDNPFHLLSEREFQIMVNLINGLGNLEICNTFGLKPTTVTTYKNRIFEKLSIKNLTDLIQLYNLYY